MSGETPWSVPKNASGVTPMTSVGMPFMPFRLTLLPTMPGSLLKPRAKRIAEHGHALVVLLILLVERAPKETRNAERRIVATPALSGLRFGGPERLD